MERACREILRMRLNHPLGGLPRGFQLAGIALHRGEREQQVAFVGPTIERPLQHAACLGGPPIRVHRDGRDVSVAALLRRQLAGPVRTLHRGWTNPMLHAA
jgi:hypothetical protein